ncbi:MAG: 30S ribosomal protein S10 [Candidatus Shikimatogenerans sp. Tser]|uniref:Small ribosomal subunit protein uS10 n=1 Tax=Candidatus Shikimatogenerans sp. Tser TaxID=3158568 RepID=A0AAU7QQA1_9FLAO
MNKKKRLKIKIYSYNILLINTFINKIIRIIYEYKGEFIGPIFLPTKKKIFTILKSPHVHKKSREQFVFSIHKRLLIIKNYNNLIINNLNKLNFFYGISMNIIK